jgi:hypothetical protein
MKQSDFCAWCGNVFRCERNHAKYCSETCRSRAWRNKNAAVKSGTEGFDSIEIDTLNLIRATSERAWLAVLHTRRTFGLSAARAALWACWCTLQVDEVDPTECPYNDPTELVFKGIPYDC